MGRLGYVATVSLDGYAADADGGLDWGAPGEEAFAAHLARIREVSVEVLGRRTAVGMEHWETYPDGPDSPGSTGPVAHQEFARTWRAIEKVVVSSTLGPDDLTAERFRIVPRLDLDELRRIVADAPGLVEIFGPTTAAPAIRAGLVDEYRFFVAPVVLGGGLRVLPDGVRLDLALVEQRVLDGRTTYVRCAPLRRARS